MTGGSKGLWLRLLTLFAALMLTAAACGGGDDDGDGGGGTGGGDGGSEEPAFETITEGVLTVGSCLDYRPFEFFKRGADEPTGFDVEITNAIADRLGLEVEWVRANFDGIFEALAGGEFDMVAAASTITPERAETVDFSEPYYNSRQALTVASDSGLASTDDLGEGDVVGVQKGTTGKAWAEDNLADAGVEIRTFDSISDAFTELESGGLDGILNDEPSSIGEVEQRPGLEVVEPIDTNEKYGLSFTKENPELRAAVNGALEEIIADGTYEQIFTKYFPSLPLPPEFEPES
jgi:polar amino acid transport system substrate-binding protein